MFKDPPDHTRLRQLVSRAFTPTVVRGRAAQVSEVVDGVLDELADADADTDTGSGSGSTVDLLHRLAYPRPW